MRPASRSTSGKTFLGEAAKRILFLMIRLVPQFCPILSVCGFCCLALGSHKVIFEYRSDLSILPPISQKWLATERVVRVPVRVVPSATARCCATTPRASPSPPFVVSPVEVV